MLYVVGDGLEKRKDDFAAEVALDLVGAVDDLAEPVDLVLREVADTRVRVDAGLLEDLLAG